MELHISGNNLSTLDSAVFEAQHKTLSLAASKPAASEEQEQDNIFDCDETLCWLKEEEESGTIIWYEYRREVFKPLCSNGKDWDLVQLNCTETLRE